MSDRKSVMISIKDSDINLPGFAISMRKLNIQSQHRDSNFLVLYTAVDPDGFLLLQQGLKLIQNNLNEVGVFLCDILIVWDQQYINITVFDP